MLTALQGLMEQTTHSILDSSLLETTINPAAKDAISQAFWGANQNEQQKIHGVLINFESYWRYYSQECENALHDGGRHVALRKHRDVAEAARQMLGGLSRKEVAEFFKSKLTTFHADEQEILDNSVDLVASLILMMRFGTQPYGFSGQSQIRWTKGSLKDDVCSFFGESNVLVIENVKLEKAFNGRNLGRIAGIEILWTDNLVDHLRMADDDQRVHVFHHASFLEIQRQSHSLLPKGLAEETLRTLALLFPSFDPATRKWFLNLPGSKQLDRRVIHCGRLKTDHRKIDKFIFWRDRLVTLKQVFDEAQPKTISQWWHDRRNGVQWYTFWVAVLVLLLTIVFGLIQSIEGAIQSYASLKVLAGVPGDGPGPAPS